MVRHALASVALVLACSCSLLGVVAGCGSDLEGPPPEGEPVTFAADRSGGAAQSTDPLADLDACVTSTATSSLMPVKLVVLYDRSASMGLPPYGVASEKWLPVAAAMKGFFNDPASTGMSAALTFFSRPGSDSCNAASFTTPDVPLTALPAAALGAAVDKASPAGNTPTRLALGGALTQAKAHADASSRTAIVLVTDGYPTRCDSGSLMENVALTADVARAALAATPPIETHVIGIGDGLTNLDAIAKAGGTRSAVLVSAKNPAVTTSELGAALARVRGQMACTFDLPRPPDGRVLDFAKVNVLYTPAGGTTKRVPFAPDCAGGAGWRHGSATPPRIDLCPATCSAVRADASAKLTLAFGCASAVR